MYNCHSIFFYFQSAFIERKTIIFRSIYHFRSQKYHWSLITDGPSMQRVPAADVSKSKIHNPNYLKHSKNVLAFALAPP